MLHQTLGLAFLLAFLPASLLVAQTGTENNFSQTNLVADTADFHPQIVNPDLIDAWGIALRPPGAGGHIWIANAVSGDSDEYIGDVNGMPLHQDALTTVPLVAPEFIDHAAPFVTGLAYNSSSDLAGQAAEFPVTGAARNATTGASLGTVTGTSKFVFVTEDGCINAWLSNSATAMYTAPIIIDYSKTAVHFPYAANCVFTGVAMTQNASSSAAYLHNGAGVTGNLVFAADQRNNAIEVIEDKKETTDTSTNLWTDVTPSFHFQTPASVGGLHPFNIMDIGGHLFVTYAEFNPAGDEGQEQVEGAGLGHLVEYNEDGTLALDFNDGANTSAGELDEPWGVAIAPAGFGKFGGDVLVANFGNGTIAAFDPNTGNFVDNLRDSSGAPISIDGIWGLVFGNGVSLGDANSLYFTAGPNSEFDGLFGKLTYNAPETDTPAMPPVGLLLLGLLLLIAGSRLVRAPSAPA